MTGAILPDEAKTPNFLGQPFLKRNYRVRSRVEFLVYVKDLRQQTLTIVSSKDQIKQWIKHSMKNNIIKPHENY